MRKIPLIMVRNKLVTKNDLPFGSKLRFHILLKISQGVFFYHVIFHSITYKIQNFRSFCLIYMCFYDNYVRISSDHKVIVLIIQFCETNPIIKFSKSKSIINQNKLEIKFPFNIFNMHSFNTDLLIYDNSQKQQVSKNYISVNDKIFNVQLQCQLEYQIKIDIYFITKNFLIQLLKYQIYHLQYKRRVFYQHKSNLSSFCIQKSFILSFNNNIKSTQFNSVQIEPNSMSYHRAFFKNDNFFMATQRQKEEKQKQQLKKLQQKKDAFHKTPGYTKKVTRAKNNQEKKQLKIKKQNQSIFQSNFVNSAEDLFKVESKPSFSKEFSFFNSVKSRAVSQNLQQVDQLLSNLKKKNKPLQQSQQIGIKSNSYSDENKISKANSFDMDQDKNKYKVFPLQRTNDKNQIDPILQEKDSIFKNNNEKVQQSTLINQSKSFNSTSIFKNIFKKMENKQLPISQIKQIYNQDAQQPYVRKVNKQTQNKNKIPLSEAQIQAKKKKQLEQMQARKRKQQWAINNKLRLLQQELKLQPQVQKKKYYPKQKTTTRPQKKTQNKKKQQANGNQQKITEEDSQKKDKKNKKIKKVANYQRLDMKRTYKDNFVGGLRQNQRKYMKNGALKFKYRIPPAEIDLEQDRYSCYANSLSKAFHVDLNLDSESDSEKQEKQQIYVPSPEQSSHQQLTKLIKAMFKFQNFRQGQFQVVKNILNNESTIFVSQTASGKSLTYILASLILGEHQEGMSIVISPLIALMLDQLQHLPEQIPAACISSLLNYQQRNKILQKVKNNMVQLLFMTPQMLMTDILFHLKQFPKINFVCIDEAHCLSELSHNFRTSYIALSQIVLNQVNYNNTNLKPNILCLTATANNQTIRSLQKKLKIKNVIKSSSTLNKNLFITVSREIGSENKYKALVEYLSLHQIQKCRGILIYCRSKYLIDKVFNYLNNSNMPATVFHGALTNRQKTQIINDFKDKTIKIIISTTALGMGLDFEHLDCIIHFNMAKSIQSFVQEIGRAGRRQTRAYCHLFLDQSDFFMERNYILADQLQSSSLHSIIQELQKGQRSSKMKIINQKKANTSKKNKRSQEQLQRVIKRATMAISKMQVQKNQERQAQNFQDEMDDFSNISNPFQDQYSQNQYEQCEFSKLCFIRAKQLAEKTYLREQALLIILMKISQTLNNQCSVGEQTEILKILPLSSQILKLSFFKANEKQLVQNQVHGQFFKKVIGQQGNDGKPTCKKVSGTYYINLITKCNQLMMTPIQFMSRIYELSNEFVMKVQLVNEVFVFSFNLQNLRDQNFNNQNSRQQNKLNIKKILQKLQNRAFRDKIIQNVNAIQNVSMTKLNVFYSVAFDFSQISVWELIKKKIVIGRQVQIPKDNIMNKITKYFNTDLNEFYKYISDSVESENQLDLETFLPTQTIEKGEIQSVYDHIKLFFKHMYSNLRDLNNQEQVRKKKESIINEYQDGKIITRVFLGVNEQKSSRLIYGEHTYWKKFIKKKYFSLLHLVRKLIQDGRQDLINS